MKSCCDEMIETPLVATGKPKKVVLAGNPNVGKSLIFNNLTGANQRIANFPGITLTHLSGRMKYGGLDYDITDLPGIYGFNSEQKEEEVAQNYLLSHEVDLIVNIVDATKLERNLFLTLQLTAMQRPMVVLLNFMDKVQENSIDIEGLEKELGVPVIPFAAIHRDSYVNLPGLIERAMAHNHIPSRSHLDEIRAEIPSNLDRDEFQLAYISAQYDLLADITSRHTLQQESGSNIWVERLDRLLLHRFFGFAIFFAIMWAVFNFTFEVSAPLSDLIDSGAAYLGDLARNNISSDFLASFLADGLIGGIGFVLVFIPQIAFLFIFLSVLEHSGYMARVVFLMDRFLSKLGISGKSIAPMLLGFGCNVPAIMATRSIKDENERIVTVLVNPFLACSARFPVFVIFAAALFGSYSGLVVTFVYFVGIAIAVGLMFVLRKTILKGETPDLILELNDLSRPPIRSVLSQAYRQVRKFIENALTWMALGLILIWLLSVTGPSGYLTSAALEDPVLLEQSWLYVVGSIFQPIFGPFGWDERLVVALIMGFIAKEIVVGSLGIIYGVGGNLLALEMALGNTFSPVSGLAFMLFVLTYTPCIGTVMAIKQEIGKRWMVISIVSSLIIAYLLASVTLLLGGLFA